MGTLGVDLVSTPQRERDGERAQERYDFQALSGMALLLKRYDAKGDYAVIFEFHDDLALVDDPATPAEVHFFQIKTKEKGSWTLTELKKRRTLRSGKTIIRLPAPLTVSSEAAIDESERLGSSVLGRMFHNIRQFGHHVGSVTFISNTHCDLHIERKFGFRQCSPDMFEKLTKAIQAEYADATEDEIALLYFERSDLSLQDASSHMKGKLHDFVTRHVGAEAFPLDSLFRLVAEECRKRSKFTGEISTFSDAVRLKGITRADVQEWLDTVSTAVQIPAWEELNNQLTYPLNDRLALRAAWRIYKAEAMSQADESLRIIRRAIRERVECGFDVLEALTDVVEATFMDVETIGRAYLSPFQPARLRAMIIYELYTQDPD